MKHTPEPWKVDKRVGCLAIYNSGLEINCMQDLTSDDRIAYWSGSKDDNGDWFVPDAIKANAARIVACVNACAGIETETLNGEGTLKEVITMRKRKYDKLKADTDRLAEALEEIASFRYTTLCVGGDDRINKLRDIARAALAAHEELDGRA